MKASPRIIPIPTYSTRIQPLLDGNKIEDDWNHFIEETAYYILKSGDMTDKAEYAIFGKQMVEKFPCVIRMRGPDDEPWVCNIILAFKSVCCKKLLIII